MQISTPHAPLHHNWLCAADLKKEMLSGCLYTFLLLHRAPRMFYLDNQVCKDLHGKLYQQLQFLPSVPVCCFRTTLGLADPFFHAENTNVKILKPIYQVNSIFVSLLKPGTDFLYGCVTKVNYLTYYFTSLEDSFQNWYSWKELTEDLALGFSETYLKIRVLTKWVLVKVLSRGCRMEFIKLC